MPQSQDLVLSMSRVFVGSGMLVMNLHTDAVC
jgi:hypothetical protein